MDDKKDYDDIDDTLTIPADYFVNGCDLDADPPYCIILHKDKWDRKDEKKVLIPKALAYYLSTHSCGSEKFRKAVDESAARNERGEIQELFETLMDKFGWKLDFEKILELAKKKEEE